MKLRGEDILMRVCGTVYGAIVVCLGLVIIRATIQYLLSGVAPWAF